MPSGGMTFAMHRAQEKSKMAQQKVVTILGVVLAFACTANAGLRKRRRQQPTQHSIRGQDQSAAAMAQEASNPFASSWALQLQQNNNWTEMPRGDDRIGCRAICSSSRC